MNCDRTAAVLAVPDQSGVAAGTACPLSEARAQFAQAAANSCGRDVFCREGTVQVRTILAELSDGRGRESDLELVDELCTLIAATASCAMATTAAARTLELLHRHREEWDQHLRRKRCSSLTCRMSFTVYAAPELCTGCGDCVAACPEQAIAGGAGLIHVVSDQACSNCLACLPACPAGALRKAGPVKPRLPGTPVPVGSFAGTDAATGGLTRRRRRRE